MTQVQGAPCEIDLKRADCKKLCPTRGPIKLQKHLSLSESPSTIWLPNRVSPGRFAMQHWGKDYCFRIMRIPSSLPSHWTGKKHWSQDRLFEHTWTAMVCTWSQADHFILCLYGDQHPLPSRLPSCSKRIKPPSGSWVQVSVEGKES